MFYARGYISDISKRTLLLNEGFKYLTISCSGTAKQNLNPMFQGSLYAYISTYSAKQPCRTFLFLLPLPNCQSNLIVMHMQPWLADFLRGGCYIGFLVDTLQIIPLSPTIRLESVAGKSQGEERSNLLGCCHSLQSYTCGPQQVRERSKGKAGLRLIKLDQSWW